MELKNSVVIISGGASGLGAATALQLTEAGARVALLDLNQDAAKALAQKIKGLALNCDVTNEKNVQEAIQQTRAHFKAPINVCLNCAGLAPSKRLVGREGPHALALFEQTLAVNLSGTFNMMRLAAAAMMAEPIKDPQAERGLIINTASIAAFEGQVGQIAYSASKGGVVSMTLPAARELAQFNIRVMCVAPGLVDTPLFETLPDEARATLSASVPFPKRLAYPAEFAQLVQHIIENPMLNGSVIRLDGALRLPPK